MVRMSKKTRRKKRRKSPTTVGSQAERETQGARGPNGHRLKFYHPVTVLEARVRDAWEFVSGLDELNFHHRNDRLKFWDNHGKPAQQALRLASSTSYGCGRWLHYGLGQRAGIFETEIRAVLRKLKSRIGVFVPGINIPDEFRRWWKDNVTKLEALLTELDNVAVDPEDLTRWYDELRACHDALIAVDQGMVELARLAAEASDSLKGQLYRLLAHLVPSFRESLAVVFPGLSYAHDCECDADCLRLDDLPSRLQMCAEDVAHWGMRNAELGVTSEDRPFQADEQLTMTHEETKGLLYYLERVLQELRLADTSEARQIGLPKLPTSFNGGTWTQRPDAGGKLKSEAKQDIVRQYLDECGGWDGPLKELSKALKEKTGLKVSPSTLSRYLKGTKYDRHGKPRRAAKGKGQREAVAEDEGPADLSHVQTWTMPDDAEDSIS